MVTVPRLARWKPDNFDISWLPPPPGGPVWSSVVPHIYTETPSDHVMGAGWHNLSAAWTVSSERQGPPPAPSPGESGVINDSEMYLSCPNNCELWTQPSLCRQFKLSHQALLPPPVTRCVNKDNKHYTTWPALIPTFQSKLTRFYFPDGPNNILVLFQTFVRQKIYMEYIVDICEDIWSFYKFLRLKVFAC